MEKQDSGKKLKELRLKSGVPLKVVAAELGVDRTTVFRWESGQSYPREALMKPIAKLYGLTYEELIAYLSEDSGRGTLPLVLDDGQEAEEREEREVDERRIEIRKIFIFLPPFIFYAILWCIFFFLAESTDRGGVRSVSVYLFNSSVIIISTCLFFLLSFAALFLFKYFFYRGRAYFRGCILLPSFIVFILFMGSFILIKNTHQSISMAKKVTLSVNPDLAGIVICELKIDYALSAEVSSFDLFLYSSEEYTEDVSQMSLCTGIYTGDLGQGDSIVLWESTNKKASYWKAVAVYRQGNEKIKTLSTGTYLFDGDGIPVL